MKKTIMTVCLTGLFLAGCTHQDVKDSNRIPAQQKTSAKGYEQYRSKIELAEMKVDRLGSVGGKEFASALISLSNLRLEARLVGYQCDLGYIQDIISPFKAALNHSPWLVKNIKSTQVYKNTAKYSLVLQLAANGFYGSQTVSTDKLVSVFNQVFKKEEFSLYKPQPGVMSMGQIDFANGYAVDVTNTFDENGDYQQIISKPRAVKVSMGSDGFLKVSYDNKPAYSIVFERDGKVIKNNVNPSDAIHIRTIGSEHKQEYHDETTVIRDECSA